MRRGAVADGRGHRASAPGSAHRRAGPVWLEAELLFRTCRWARGRRTMTDDDATARRFGVQRLARQEYWRSRATSPRVASYLDNLTIRRRVEHWRSSPSRRGRWGFPRSAIRRGGRRFWSASSRLRCRSPCTSPSTGRASRQAPTLDSRADPRDGPLGAEHVGGWPAFSHRPGDDLAHTILSASRPLPIPDLLRETRLGWVRLDERLILVLAHRPGRAPAQLKPLDSGRATSAAARAFIVQHRSVCRLAAPPMGGTTSCRHRFPAQTSRLPNTRPFAERSARRYRRRGLPDRGGNMLSSSL